MVQAIGQWHARVAVSSDRKPAQADGEYLHQDEAEPEARNARAQHRESGERMVDRFAAPDGGNDAAWNADQHGDAEGEYGEEKRGLGAFGERLSDGSLQEDGLAEIAASELAQPIGELHRQR